MITCPELSLPLSSLEILESRVTRYLSTSIRENRLIWIVGFEPLA